jgi:prolyl oligopeptidase
MMRLLFLATIPVLACLSSAMPPTAFANEPLDPYLWLEEVTGEKPLEWVRERNTESEAALAGTDRFKALESRILGILDSKERIPMVTKIGDHFYNLWRDAANPKGLWRRTTLAEYRKQDPAWEIVLDLDALSAKEGENWVWHGASVLEPEDRLCLLSLSRGGADADVMREFDLETKAFVDGGFTLPEAKSRVAWRAADSLFVATDFGPGSLTASGYPRTIREWTRGTPLATAPVVYEGQPDDMSVTAWRDLTPGFERDVVVRQKTFYTSEMFLRREGGLVKIEKPDDATAALHREWLLFELRSAWTVGATTHPAGSLLATDLEAFLTGSGTMHVLFTPAPRTSLISFASTRNHLLVTTLDNVRNRLHVLTFEDGAWQQRPLQGLPEYGTASCIPVDDLETDDFFLITASSLQPSTLSLGSAADTERQPEKLKQSPSFFDVSGLAVSQHEAVSKDGTRVPYFQIGPKTLPTDGSTPTLLYGYGGFEIPLLPGYEPIAGAAWLEQRHVYVIANIRGGGEFGPEWHQAALKAKRPRAYEDFIAVAEDLIARKVTSPQHLGIKGGSNGGLLVGNMLTMRPDLFGGVVCQVPLLDMRRFHTLLAGASWMGEYGNPDNPEEWEFIRGFSPYHNLQRETVYPPVLITTSTRDDRVHPGHARKMAARLQELGKRVLYYENIEGGHGGAANNRQRAFMDTLGYTFLDRELE